MIDRFNIKSGEVSFVFIESSSAMRDRQKSEKFENFAKAHGGRMSTRYSFEFDLIDEEFIEKLRAELDHLLEDDECVTIITSVPAQSKKIILGKPVSRDVPIIVRSSN